MIIVPYSASYKKLALLFNSGNSTIDNFLHSDTALDYGVGKTYIALSDDKKVIIGFYSLGVGYIEMAMNGERIKVGGSAHILDFAIDTRYQHKSYGSDYYLSDILLVDCLGRIERIRRSCVGYSFVTLCSTQRGYSLYKRNGFEDLEEDMGFVVDKQEQDCKLMYLPLDME